MQSNLFIGVVAGIGLAAWVYNKLQRSTGGNTTGSLTAAAIIGVLACLVVTFALGFIS